MNNKFTYRYSYILSLMLLLLLPACRHESWSQHEDDLIITEGDEKYFVLEIQTPALNPPSSTRAMSVEDEKKIKTLKVLVFEGAQTNNEQDEKYVYTANVLAQDALSGSTDITKVKVRLRTDETKEYRLVLIANYPGTFPNLTEGETKSDVFAKLESSFNHKWEAIEDSSTIPMWGESNLTLITNENTTFTDFKNNSEPIMMTRSLARVDVGINFVSDLESEDLISPNNIPFKLTSVAVYRTGTSFLIPGTQASLGTRVTLPSGFTTNDDNTPLLYELASAGDRYIREIYIPERAAGTSNSNAPCLIIGGYYGADNSSKVTYYRADFVDADTKKYLPILRNHRYRFNITKVSGPGFDTPGQALKSKPENLEVKVTKWNEANVGTLVTDGQYALGVSKDKLSFYKDAETQEITIQTDWADGWKANVVGDTDWITLNPIAGEANIEGKLSITTAINNTETVRIGKVLITAGRMEWVINVTQKEDAKLSIQLFNGEETEELSVMDFTAISATKKIVVKYQPSDGNLKYTLASGADFTLQKVENESEEGKAVYSITSQEMKNENDDFESIINFIDFTVTDDAKRSMTKRLTVAQVEHNVVPYIDKDLTLRMDQHDFAYFMDGKSETFYIKANTPYKINISRNSALPNDGGGGKGTLITENQSSWVFESNGKFNGDTIKFTPFNDIYNENVTERFTRRYGRVEYTITSTHPDGEVFAPKQFTILLVSGKIQKEANCYFMKPAKAGILIPVSRINTAHNEYERNKADFDRNKHRNYEWDKFTLPQLGESEDWYPDLIWSDMEPIGTKPINADGTAGLGAVKKIGEGSKGYIFILPGTNEKKIGNALIACRRRSDDTILWSWHIWMVDEYPTVIADKWLDRNLGANKAPTSNEDRDVNTYGMQYQWGRKDPFPLLATHGKEKFYRPLVDKNGNEFTLEQINNTQSMRISIQHPARISREGNHWMREYRGINNYDTDKLALWYNVWGGANENITSDYNSANLTTTKSVFDPSPYGWKIPALGAESDWDSTLGMFFPRTGTYYDGNLGNFTWHTSNDYKAVYAVSTTWSNDGAGRHIFYDNNSIKRDDKTYNRAMGHVIRPVYNKNEASYKDYLP